MGVFDDLVPHQAAVPARGMFDDLVPKRAELNAGETAIDVAKSAGIGLVQGGVGLATLPGNLEYIARAGIDKAAITLGFEDPQTSQSTVLPTYGNAKGGIEKYTGEFYEPQSTAGEYARSVGEFAPLAAFGGGGLAARAANVIAPAVVSETAGQLTKGTQYEPWARAGGALAGGFLPNAVMRGVTPITSDATRAAQVATLEREGVTALTAGQKTGSKPLRWAESVTQDTPFGGGRASQIMTDQAEQFTAATLRRAGVNAKRATPDVVDGAYTALGKQFDDLSTRNNIRVDQKFLSDLNSAWKDYSSVTPISQRAPVVEAMLHDIMGARKSLAPYPRMQNGNGQIYGANNGALTGVAYQAMRSRLEKMSRGVRMSNPELSEALGNIRGALDDVMERSISKTDATQWKQIRGQYRNLVAIEKAATGAGENAAMGLISPSALRNAVKSQSQRGYARGKGDLTELARAGEAVMKALPQSGTAPRAAAHATFNALGAVGGNSIAGLPGALAGVAAPAVTARTLMSRPMQNYLSNRVMERPLGAYEANRLNALARSPQAAMQGAMYDENGDGPMIDEYGNPVY